MPDLSLPAYTRRQDIYRPVRTYRYSPPVLRIYFYILPHPHNLKPGRSEPLRTAFVTPKTQHPPRYSMAINMNCAVEAQSLHFFNKSILCVLVRELLSIFVELKAEIWKLHFPDLILSGPHDVVRGVGRSATALRITSDYIPLISCLSYSLGPISGLMFVTYLSQSFYSTLDQGGVHVSLFPPLQGSPICTCFL